MSFLTPWFLLGALAVAGPLIFHLVRRTTRERIPFSTLLFLRPAPPRLTRRNRLDDRLLLALRCLVVALVAAGFARPFLNRPTPAVPAGEPARLLVVLVDTSASMRRGNLWDTARNRAGEIFRRAAAGDQLALLTFDQEVRTRLSFEEWNATPPGERAALAGSRLAAVTPGWAATHLDTALIRASEMLAEAGETTTAPGERQVVLLSDLQAGARLSALQAYEWPKEISVRVEALPGSAENASVHWLPENEEASATAPDGAVRLLVVNTPESRRDQFRLGWWRPETRAWLVPPLEVYLPPGQSRVLTLHLVSNAPAEALRLEGDEEPFDNGVFVAPPAPARLTVLHVGSDAEHDSRGPRFFLARAFQPTPRRAVEFLTWNPAGTPAPAAAVSADLAVVTTSLSPPVIELARTLLNAGRWVLFAPPDANALAGLAALIPGGDFRATDQRLSGYALLAELDFSHPLLAPFADPRFSDFTRIRFWQYRRFDCADWPGARVLARLDTADPAMVEAPVGAGRLLVWASGWPPTDSQLALSTKFVPLLHVLLDLSAGPPPAVGQYFVGEALPLPRLPGAGNSTPAMRRPDGSVVPLTAGETRYLQTSEPGIYRLEGDGIELRWAVNLTPAESRLAPLPAEELERWGVPLAGARPAADVLAAREARLQRAELEARQKLWWWVLLAALALVALETLAAGWAARRANPPREATA